MIDKRLEEMENAIKAIAMHVKDFRPLPQNAEPIALDAKKWAERAEALCTKTEAIYDRLSAETNAVSALKEGIESRHDSMSDLINTEIEKTKSIRDGVSAKLELLDSKLRRLDLGESRESVEKLRKEIYDSVAERLEGIEKKIDVLKRIEISGKTGTESIQAIVRDEIDKAVGEKSEGFKKSMQDFYSRLNNIEKRAEGISHYDMRHLKEINSRLALHEKSIDDIAAYVKGIESGEEYSVRFASIDKKIQGMEAKLSAFESEEKEDIRSLEELSAENASLQKAHQDIELRLSGMSEKLAAAGGIDFAALMKEIRANRAMMHGIERGIETKASAIAVKYLDEFAKAMDRSMPKFVSRDELAQFAEELRRAKPSNLPALEKKVEFLDRKIDEVLSALKSFSSKVPLVVE